MLASAPLAGLRTLATFSCGFGIRHVAALLGACTFAGLRELRMENETDQGQAFRPVEWAARLPNLRRLTLRRVGAGVVGAFRAAPSWPRDLPSLDLAGSLIGPEGLGTRAGHADLSGLRELDLALCGASDRGVRALAESSTLTRLERLDLTGRERR